MSRNLVILPVYNQASRIRNIVRAIDESLGNQTDILVVDDASEDGTAMKIHPSERIVVMVHEAPLGYGAALARGLHYAEDNQYDYAVTLDVSAEDPQFAFTPIMKSLRDGYDIVNASRMSLDDRGVANEDYSAIDTGSIVADMLNSSAGLSLIDPFSPFKGYKISSIGKLEIEEYDESAVIQIWVQSVHHGLRITEIIPPEIHKGYIHEGEYLEKDIDHYIAFIKAERILYPDNE